MSIAALALLAGHVASLPSAYAEPADERVEALLARMTLEEKLGQLTQVWGGETQDINPGAKQQKLDEILATARSGSVGSFLGAQGADYTNRLQRAAVEESRLKIPMLLGNDIIHGYKTIFPIPLGEAASFDADLVERTCRAAAAEARAAGTNWTFAPMIDVSRDPRWGRIAESAGEDPYLNAVMAAARVRGFQGADLAAPDAVLACAKHFVAYGGAEGGRDYNTVDISVSTLRDVYLPPFRAAVDAGVGSLMSAFNEIGGMPASANPLTLNQVLRTEWKFRGFVVSDWTSVTEMIVHGYAANPADAALKAIGAGVDMDMCSLAYRSQLADAVKQGALPESVVDEAVRRVLRAKLLLGLFENPYADPAREAAVVLSAAHRALARESACKSMVLLRNEGGALPLRDTVRAVAVIGPLADSRQDPLGTWAAFGKPETVVTVVEGVRRRIPNAEVRYVQGCEVDGAATAGFAEAVEVARSSEVAIVVVGESEAMSGEGRSRASLDLPGAQQELVRAVHATGTPTVVVLLNGRPLSILWLNENVPAILEAWHPGVECGNAVADVLFGDFNPGGKLPASFPRTVGQVPIYYNHKNTGRPPTEDRYTSKYIDVPATPLFPFGHGLSYTRFVFENLTVEPPQIARDGAVEVRIEIRNVGERSGDEVAQLYVRDVVGSLTRPVKELRGFRRLSLQPGEARTVSFTLRAAELGFHNQEGRYVVEPGEFHVWIGPNSADGPQSRFEILP